MVVYVDVNLKGTQPFWLHFQRPVHCSCSTFHYVTRIKNIQSRKLGQVRLYTEKRYSQFQKTKLSCRKTYIFLPKQEFSSDMSNAVPTKFKPRFVIQ